MPRSRPSNFSSGVRHILIRRHRWLPEKASKWVRENKPFLRKYYDSGCNPEDVAFMVDKEHWDRV